MMNTTMRKLILVCAIVVLAGGGSALAQKPIVIIGPPDPLFDQALSVEDDANGSFLVFNTGSGKYTFTRCDDGFTLSGVGFVKVSGCSITLEDVRSDHRVVTSVNECGQQAKAIVEVFLPAAKTNRLVDPPPLNVTPFKSFLTDQNMANNLMDCAPKK